MKTTSPCSGCTHTSTRRQWIQRLAMSSAAYSALSGLLSPPSARAAIFNLSERLRLDLAAFPALEFNGTSIIITYDGGTSQIMINRESETDFYALEPICSHQRQQLPIYNFTNTNTIVCPLHGSQFSISGQVLGQPAVTNLNTYATQFEGPSTLNVEVPGFVHRLDEIAVHSSSLGSTRMKLTFPTMNGSLYKIRYSPDLTSPFEVAIFTTTATGTPDQDIFEATGAPATVYVDTPDDAGFFTLELMVFQMAP